MGSDFAEFFRQPFVGPVLGMMCIFALLLVAVVAALVVVRRRRAQAQLISVAGIEALDVAGTSPGDLPDLAALVSDLPPAAPTPAAETQPLRAAPKGTFTVAVTDGGSADVVEVMAVLRDVVDGRLIVQMGEHAYHNISSDPAFKDRFTRLMRELAQIARPPAPEPEAAPRPPAPEAEAAPPPSAPEAPAQSIPSAAPPPPLPGGQMPGALPKFNLDDQGPIKLARGQKREIKPVPEINIAAAIEAYLQHKLRHTPDYQGRSIHIIPAPDGGLYIEVDGLTYESVSDVADPQIRAFLQTTIQEWQEQQT